MPTRPVRHTTALATTGTVVVFVLVVSSGLGDLTRAVAWVSIAGAAVAVLLAAVRAIAPAALSSLAALALAASDAATFTDGSAVGRGFLVLAPPCAVALSGLAITPVRRVATVIVACGAVVGGPLRSLFFDPFLNAACAGCRHSAFAVFGDNDIAVVLGVLGGALITVGLVLLGATSAHRLPAAAVTVAAGVGTVTAQFHSQATAAAAVAVAAGVGVVVGFGKLRRRDRLVVLKRAPQTPDALLAALRRAFRDPTLEVRYTVEPDQQVDSSGAPVGALRHDRRSTRIMDFIGLEHDPATDVEGVLEAGVPAQLMVSLEQQRLTAELTARLQTLAESRARVVRRADLERQRLERDLHDGAQQHLLALGFDLRRALVSAKRPAVREALERCLAMTMKALDETRDIAHGVYPPLLALSGLAPALRALPGIAAVDFGDAGRGPASIERLGYLVVEELARGAHDGVRVHGRRDGSRLVLEISGSDVTPSALIRERVGALTATLDRRGQLWRLEMPCA